MSVKYLESLGAILSSGSSYARPEWRPSKLRGRRRTGPALVGESSKGGRASLQGVGGTDNREARTSCAVSCRCSRSLLRGRLHGTPLAPLLAVSAAATHTKDGRIQ